MTMDIPEEAHKDHQFSFVEVVGRKNSTYNVWVYKCENCGIKCLVGRGYAGHWAYQLCDSEGELVKMSEWEVEALKCNEVLVMDILK